MSSLFFTKKTPQSITLEPPSGSVFFSAHASFSPFSPQTSLHAWENMDIVWVRFIEMFMFKNIFHWSSEVFFFKRAVLKCVFVLHRHYIVFTVYVVYLFHIVSYLYQPHYSVLTVNKCILKDFWTLISIVLIPYLQNA